MESLLLNLLLNGGLLEFVNGVWLLMFSGESSPPWSSPGSVTFIVESLLTSFSLSWVRSIVDCNFEGKAGKVTLFRLGITSDSPIVTSLAPKPLLLVTFRLRWCFVGRGLLVARRLRSEAPAAWVVVTADPYWLTTFVESWVLIRDMACEFVLRWVEACVVKGVVRVEMLFRPARPLIEACVLRFIGSSIPKSSLSSTILFRDGIPSTSSSN